MAVVYFADGESFNIPWDAEELKRLIEKGSHDVLVWSKPFPISSYPYGRGKKRSIYIPIQHIIRVEQTNE